MTNSTKKPAKASRENLDLDLDARLDQATSTLSLDDEPVAGDALDQVLANAKKELDTDLPEDVLSPTVERLDDLDSFFDDVDLDGGASEVFQPIQSEAMTSLENQLAAAMDSTVVTDEELDDLLGGAGYDFDSLLGEAASDELTTDAGDDALMAAVDELLNIGAFTEEPEIIEPEVEEETVIEPKPKRKAKAKSKPQPEIKPEVVADEIVELEPEIEPEVVADEIVELETEIEPEVVADEIVELELKPEIEPEVVADKIVELEPEIEPEVVADEIVELEPEIEPEVVADEIVELETEIEPEENELESDFELTVDPEAALDDLVDSVPFEDLLVVDTDDTELDDIHEEFNDFDDVADIDAPLVEMSASIEPFEDDLDEMQQLDGLNDAMENKNDTTAGFDLLDDDAVEKEQVKPVTEDDDWMKQLEGLDAEESTKSTEAVAETVEEDDDDWMKQLEGLDAEEVEKSADAVAETVDDDDWMKQLDDLDNHDEDTAKMLMDVGHGQDTDADEVVNNRFNISDEDRAQQNPNRANPIDEEALVAKVADLAISQFKEEQDHVFSQLRADQDIADTKNRTQFADAENKRKKSATFGYIALGVGIIGVLGSAGIGWMSYGTKDEATNLTQSVTALEEKVNTFLAKNPEKEIENIKISVEQLNQKVEKIAAAQVVVPPVVVATAPVEVANGKISPIVATKPNSSVDLLNSKKTTPVTAPNVDAQKIADFVSPIDISPASPTGETTPIASAKTAEPLKLVDMAKKPVVDTTKEKAAAKAETDKALAKAEAELLSQKIAKINSVAKTAASTNSKVEEQRKLLTQSKADHYSGRMTRGMSRGGSDKGSTVVEVTKTKSVTKQTATKEVLNVAVKPQKAIAAGKYSVNMLSYQQEWFAQSKAAEFKQKGIPVEVVPIDATKPGTKFRLKVGGFKNKAEADAYSDKVKKSLNLKETWVGSNN